MNQRRKQQLDKQMGLLEKDQGENRLDLTFVQEEANKERGVAYVIKDVWVGNLEIKYSANAWWMDSHKVEILIAGLKEGHTVRTACIYAGISRAMWQYFNKVHPEFIAIIEVCEEYLTLHAMDTIRKDIGNPKTARWYLEHRHPKFKSRFTLDDLQGRLLPSMNTNFGINEDGSPEEIAEKLRQTADAILMDAKISREKMSAPVQ